MFWNWDIFTVSEIWLTLQVRLKKYLFPKTHSLWVWINAYHWGSITVVKIQNDLMISNVMFVSDFYCHVWVSSLQVHFSCDSSSLASCLQFQYLAQSGRWCLLGSPMWLTDDWTHISFRFTCIYICTSDALSLANDTHPFASSLIISLCMLPKMGGLSPKVYTQVRYFVRLQVALQKGCTIHPLTTSVWDWLSQGGLQIAEGWPCNWFSQPVARVILSWALELAGCAHSLYQDIDH